jgi:hypothetical protein
VFSVADSAIGVETKFLVVESLFRKTSGQEGQSYEGSFETSPICNEGRALAGSNQNSRRKLLHGRKVLGAIVESWMVLFQTPPNG